MTDTTAQTNQTASAATPINASFDKNVDVKDFKFRWKKDKLGNQRSNVELKAGVPSIEGFVAILEAGGKGLELLQEAAYGVIRDSIGSFLSENEDATAANVDLTQFTWDKIANQPAADRRASSIPEETWTGFATDYIDIMPQVTGKSKEAVTNATLIYGKKFSMVKSNKPVLKALKEQLGIYANSTKKGEEFAEILELLTRKVDTYIGSNDVELLVANL